MNFLTTLADDLEGPDPVYSGRHDVQFAVYGTLAFFLYTFLGRAAVWNQNYAPTMGEVVFEAIFDTLGFLPVLFLLSPPGMTFARRELDRYNGILLQLAVAALIIAYFLVGLPLGFESVYSQVERVENFIPGRGFPLNLGICLAILVVFLRVPLVVFRYRDKQTGPLYIFKHAKEYKELVATLVLAGFVGMFVVVHYVGGLLPFSPWAVA